MKHNLVADFGPLNKITKEQIYSVVNDDLVSIDMLVTKSYPNAAVWRKAVERRDSDFHFNSYAEDVMDFTVLLKIQIEFITVYLTFTLIRKSELEGDF